MLYLPLHFHWAITLVGLTKGDLQHGQVSVFHKRLCSGQQPSLDEDPQICKDNNPIQQVNVKVQHFIKIIINIIQNKFTKGKNKSITYFDTKNVCSSLD